MMANGLLTTKSIIEECLGQEEEKVRTSVKDVFKISKIMAFTAKDNCPESNRNDWSYWNEDKKKWKLEKPDLSARCDYPPLDNDSAVEKEGKMVISYQLQLKLQHVCYL